MSASPSTGGACPCAACLGLPCDALRPGVKPIRQARRSLSAHSLRHPAMSTHDRLPVTAATKAARGTSLHTPIPTTPPPLRPRAHLASHMCTEQMLATRCHSAGSLPRPVRQLGNPRCGAARANRSPRASTPTPALPRHHSSMALPEPLAPRFFPALPPAPPFPAAAPLAAPFPAPATGGGGSVWRRWLVMAAMGSAT